MAAHNLERGERAGAAIDGDLRAALRTELGREWFVRDVGRGPHERREHPQVEDERPSTSAT
ncbi:MAG: hypothetical protein ACR2FF_08115 [Mycobacteriales bacterium]|nr:MAG: hypothetical protein DLM56_04665 [Pseudonocardiales bacterium]